MKDINEALSELRGAFPRVSWTGEPFAGSSIMIVGRHAYHPSVVVLGGDDEWRCDGAPGLTPVSAVRSWLAAQPTAAFYPEAPSGEVVEVKGFVAICDSGAAAFYGDTGGEADNAQAVAVFHLDKVTENHRSAYRILPVVIRVPVPAEPPTLVGEVVP